MKNDQTTTPETDELDCASFEREIMNLHKLPDQEFLLRVWLGKTSFSIFELLKVEEEFVEAMQHGNVMPEHWLMKARQERDEAREELREWQTLRLWGGTPEHIHDFIKGQQSRIREVQDIEKTCEKLERELEELRK